MTDPSILVEQRAGYRVVTLNRPDRLNAFNDAMHRGAARRDRGGRSRRKLPRAHDHRRRPRLLHRAGPAATAWPSRARPSCSAPRRRRITIRWCANCAPCRFPWSPRSTASPPAPAATSRSPATSCSPARSASFVQAFARVGLVPDSGGSWFLPRLVGDARARGLALLAEPLPAEKAEDWGLIWKCVDDTSLARRGAEIV